MNPWGHVTFFFVDVHMKKMGYLGVVELYIFPAPPSATSMMGQKII